MSAEEKLIQRVLSAGVAGVKKTDLRKEFAEEEIEPVIEQLISEGKVFLEKKGVAYYCWHKEYYFQNLLNSDPKFRLIYETIKSLALSINKTSDILTNTIETFSNNISDLSKLVSERNEVSNFSEKLLFNISTTENLDRFKDEFDTAITNYSSSIGWVELAKIRNELSNKLGLSSDEFYRLVEHLTNRFPDKYELSTGGYEGITVRGLVHGFVRNI
jgi:hypothetical protein